MKVALGIAYYRSMCVPTFASLWRVARSYKGRLDVLTEGSCYVHWNREELLEKALKGDYSHLWFVDTDVTFPPDTLDRLLAHDVDIVGGYYRVRQENPINSTLSINVGGVLTPASPPFPDKLFCTLNGHDVMVIPTGCMLIRLSVVEKLKPPYFRCERPIGEDVFFCSWLWNAGVKIWCDPTIEVGHIGECVF
jgi:GT2 family glycosyltransferase